MLSRAVASVFFEEHWPQKLPIHELYAGVARDSCLPSKCYCPAASRAAACRAPVALLVASPRGALSQVSYGGVQLRGPNPYPILGKAGLRKHTLF